MSIFINPGTEPREGTEANAIEAARRFCSDLGEGATFERKPDGDFEGYFAFDVTYADATQQVDFPGCDPDLTVKGEPWVSPRIYVDGSSWLYGIGLSAFGGDDE